jgi:exodeoxyribonuclease VII large subunit
MGHEAMMSVSSLNSKIKSLLELTFVSVLVEGEVSSATYHSSGHLYFTIKDNESAIKCVSFRSSVAKIKFRLEVGQKIIVGGSISVYAPRGEYQFYATSIEPYGEGGAALAFEQLKEKLSKKGYFDGSIKKQIPKIIKKLALITAKDSAALHDMLKIIDKRWRMLDVVIVDTLVQGESAPLQISKAIKYADTLGCDAIVVGRGGGSSDDLWAFNTEIVADAIFECSTSIISAVGHEIDIMISDFVADLRAPTPSAAIEMILPDFKDILFMLDEQREQYSRIISHKIAFANEKIKQLKTNIEHASPLKKVKHMEQQYTQAKDDLFRLINYRFEIFSQSLEQYKKDLERQINFVIIQKGTYLKDFHNGYILTNPKNRCNDGIVRAWLDGKPTSLSTLHKGELFMIEDSTATLQVECLEIKLN